MKSQCSERIFARVARGVAASVLALAMTATATTCKLPFARTADAHRVDVSSQSITLAWDAPALPRRLAPTGYRVYVAPANGGEWRLLVEVGASDSPEHTVTFADVGAGEWIFAIRTVGADGVLSEFHTSIDAYAEPLGGWFVHWTGDSR